MICDGFLLFFLINSANTSTILSAVIAWSKVKEQATTGKKKQSLAKTVGLPETSHRRAWDIFLPQFGLFIWVTALRTPLKCELRRICWSMLRTITLNFLDGFLGKRCSEGCPLEAGGCWSSDFLVKRKKAPPHFWWTSQLTSALPLHSPSCVADSTIY